MLKTMKRAGERKRMKPGEREKGGRGGLLKWLRRGFRAGVILKGIDGLLEIAGGVLLIFLSPRRLAAVVRLLTQHELAGRHTAFIGYLLLKASGRFTPGAQKFGVWYLLSHGLVKIVLVALLLAKKRWAYPAAMIFLAVFMAYQVYRFAVMPAAWLVVLTAFDAAVLALTFVEYRRLIKERGSIRKPGTQE
jgi:uncharacterized membrane protein